MFLQLYVNTFQQIQKSGSDEVQWGTQKRFEFSRSGYPKMRRISVRASQILGLFGMLRVSLHNEIPISKMGNS